MKWYIVHTNASGDACGAQLSQEHDRTECNHVNPLAGFLNGKNANNKVNRWGFELATYNITFEWILGAWNKAANHLSLLVELPQARSATVQMLSATNLDGPAFNTISRTAQHNTTDATPQPQSDAVTPDVTDTSSITPKTLTTDRIRHYYKCREQIHSLNASPNVCQTEKHPNTILISSYMWKAYSTNISCIQTKNSWLLSYLNHGNTQSLWKHMTNLVTRELHAHIVS